MGAGWELSWALGHCELVPGALETYSSRKRRLGVWRFCQETCSVLVSFSFLNGEVETEEQITGGAVEFWKALKLLLSIDFSAFPIELWQQLKAATVTMGIQ